MRNLFLFIVFLFALTASGEDASTLRNPVMPGFNPDPSICRVGDDYYLTTSSFTWFPGIPVYHSRDLVNWELIGHAIDRPGMVDMKGLNDNDGTWAATIRYHEGTFYIITTASKSGGNFYVTATSPQGPWSDPVWLKDAHGIDPSLFFDDDGKCYYTGNRWDFKHSWTGQCAVWVQELDLKQGKLVGERKIIAYGHANNAKFAEGPHIYKVNGQYLLLMAEGGSGSNHAITAHHAKNIFGPYVADQINPVLSHRHLGKNFPITNIGHADLVDTPDGNWYAVVLGNRMVDGMSTLGRETFLCRVDFENGSPIFNAGYGQVRQSMERPQLPWSPVRQADDREEFDSDQLPLGWYGVRIPDSPFYSLSGGKLCLRLRQQVIDSLDCASMLIRKIPDIRFSATASLSFKAKSKDEQAGIVLYRTANGYLALMKGKTGLSLIRKRKGIREIVAQTAYTQTDVFLRIAVDGSKARFSYSGDNTTWNELGEAQSMDAVADDGKYNKFNGTGIGVYATANGKKSKTTACFDWFEYERQ